MAESPKVRTLWTCGAWNFCQILLVQFLRASRKYLGLKKNNLVNNGRKITNFNWLASRISELPTVVLDFVSLTF